MSGHSWSLRSLGDEEIILRLKALVSQERESLTDVVEHLIEMDRRELAVDKGFPSLFVYCTKVLGYSEAQSYLRIRAARAARQFPRVLSDLRDGRLHLDSIARVYPHLTDKNSDTLLQRVSGATKNEVLNLLAHFETGPAVERDIVMTVPVQPAGPPGMSAAPTGEPVDASLNAELISPPRQRFHFTADAELLALVDRLRGLLRHKYPSGRFELIFKEAAEALLVRIDPGRRPRHRSPSKRTPAASQRACSMKTPSCR